jgi:hypothetical protein
MNECRAAFRCMELMEDLLREEYHAMRMMKERGQNTRLVEFRIARMEYALGERKDKPTLVDFKKEV